jgi:hypothetical protein
VDKRIVARVRALRPTVKKRLQRVVRKLPSRVSLLVTSAHRTREEQAALRPTFGVKAKPGASPHEDGRAVDVNVLVDGKRVSPRRNQSIIGPAMASEGFRHLGPADPVHYSVPREMAATPADDPDLEILTYSEMQELAQQSAVSSQQSVPNNETTPAAELPRSH